jgi:uncharacterized protein (UPF0248 family)
MVPIHKLLDRIRWDKNFGQGHFEIGYYDRHQDAIQRVELQAVTFPKSGERHTFELVDESGHARRIPFHRIREVYQDGKLIWQRGSGSAPAL